MSNEGKKVKVHYVGTLDDGTKLPVSRRRQAQLREQVMGRKDSGTA